MAVFPRVLAVTKWGFTRRSDSVFVKHHISYSILSRLFYRAYNPESFEPTSPSKALIAKLLHELNSGVKLALENHENLIRRSDTLFLETLVTALGASSVEKAQLVLEWKLEKLLVEKDRDPNCYSNLISLSGKLQNIPFAFKVFTSMESQGIRPNAATFNTLISACGFSGKMTTAISLFEIMNRTEYCKPNLATYNVFISICSRLGDIQNMQGWYAAGKNAGFSPDLQTFEHLISGFVRAEKFVDAERYYKEMILSGITPNVPILEFMIEGLCKQKKLNEIKEFLKAMVDGGWVLNESIGEKLFGLYFGLRRINEMEELLVLMDSVKNSSILSRIHCGIIRIYALSDKLDDLEYSVGRMLKEGIVFSCAEDVEAVICSYFRKESYERLDLFLDRIRDSHNLAKSTFDLLVAGYRRVGLFKKLDLIVEEMKIADQNFEGAQ